MKTKGQFVISLDFELLWGVRDKKTIASYGKNILGGRDAVAKMLEMFDAYSVKGTFATVGLLFASNKNALLELVPTKQPSYANQNLSPYNDYLSSLGTDVKKDPYHYAADLIDLIEQYPEQEVATHTFAHYYCLEEGQTVEEFEADMEAAKQAAKRQNIELKSLVFPRNQFNEEYLAVCADKGITSYRGNEKAWFYKAEKGADETKLKRAFRLLDTYINISGHNCSSLKEIAAKKPYNIPSSRFLRPFSTKLKILEGLRLRRIKKSMTHAAKHGLVFHLWWHPHNFGNHQKENFGMLQKILEHYQELHKTYSFGSATMGELANIINGLND
ncbi:MAG: polysaccharide deacetylase family protein [Aureispira sp.]|nr:polysaccharide deacetylase family protein [Aureispira sp.]